MAERKKLSDILRNSDSEIIGQFWENSRAAEDLGPIPSGEYRCTARKGELTTSRSGTPGYKLTFEVLDGVHAGRRVWHDIWLTPAAIPFAKRDLAKLGVTSLEQLDQPLPEGIIVNLKVAHRTNDDGTAFNRVTRFDVTGFEPPEEDPFAPIPADRGTPPGPRPGLAKACLTSDEDGFDSSGGQQTK